MARTVIGDSTAADGLNVNGSIQVGGTEVINSAGEIKADIKDTLAYGSIYVGDATNTTSEVDFSGNGKILVGNGTTATSQTLGGDGSVNGTGTLTITQAAGAFDVKGGALSSTKTDDGALGATLGLEQVSTSPAPNDVVGLITFDGKDDGAGDDTYASISGIIADASAGAEFGGLVVAVADGTGSTSNVASFTHDGASGFITTGFVQGTGSIGTTNGTVTAREYGDGMNHTTVLTLTGEAVPGPAGAANEDIGYLLYTFPAGAHVHEVTYMSVALQGGGVVNADTPEVGIGSVIAAGASATLAGTEMDYVTAQSAADCSGTATVAGPLGATAGVLTGISLNTAANVKTVHLNYADLWAGADTLAATGTVVLKWTSLA